MTRLTKAAPIEHNAEARQGLQIAHVAVAGLCEERSTCLRVGLLDSVYQHVSCVLGDYQ